MSWFIKRRKADGTLTVWEKNGSTENLVATVHEAYTENRQSNAELIRDAPAMRDLLKLVREQALQIPDCQLLVGMISEHFRRK